MSFKDDGDWAQHVSEYLGFLDELASPSELLTDEANVSKIMRALSSKFGLLIMAASFAEISLETMVRVVDAHVERRRKIKGACSSGINPIAKVVDGFRTSIHAIHPSFINLGRGRGTYAFGNYLRTGRANCFRGVCGGCGDGFRAGTQVENCHYCGEPGHFIKFCRHRIQVERPVRIQKTS